MEPKWYVCLIVASLMSLGAKGSWTVCPLTYQKYLSLNYTLLPTTNIQASSEDVDGRAEYITQPDQFPWCTNQSLSKMENGTAGDHYVNITFTETVVLTMLESGGYINGYVNNFTIKYSTKEDSEDFDEYGIIEHPENFIVKKESATDVGIFTLGKPIAVRKLQLIINGGVLDPSDRLCWRLKLFGCTLVEAVVINETGSCHKPPNKITEGSPSASCSTSPTPYPPATPLESQCPGGSLKNAEEWLSQSNFIVVIVPLCTLVLILLITVLALSLLMCIRCHRTSKIGSKEGRFEGVTNRMMGMPTQNHDYIRQSKISMLDDAEKFVYDVPRPVGLVYDVPRSARSGSSTVDTPDSFLASIYDRPRMSSEENKQTDSPTEDEVVYEPIPDIGLSDPTDRDYDDIPEPAPTAQYAIVASSRQQSSVTDSSRSGESDGSSVQAEEQTQPEENTQTLPPKESSEEHS